MDNNPHHDPTHSLSEKQTNTDTHKGSTALAALTDPKFPLPTLTSTSSPLRYILSFATLAALMVGGIAGAWYLEAELLQVTEQPVVAGGGLFVIVMLALFLTGTVWVDWFELVVGYWWLSMPIGALAGLALVLNQEASATIHETE